MDGCVGKKKKSPFEKKYEKSLALFMGKVGMHVERRVQNKYSRSCGGGGYRK